jgi:hypothetical protein
MTESDLAGLVKRWHAAQIREAQLREEVRAAVVLGCDDGSLTEAGAARITGVDRMTVRSWRGKR